MSDDTLTPSPVPDRFEHESPLRAFSEWNEEGLYAIGKGLRPSAKHLPVYLDAIERKEGWQLVQMLLDDHGAFRSAIFRRDPAKVVETIEIYGVTAPRPYPALANPAFGAPFGTSPVEEGRDVYETMAGHINQQAEKVVDERQIKDGMRDDPVNPKHYGGTACAEIGERLTANCYQVLKYCWRLGEKDDPKIELGKAIWYAKREQALGLPRSRKGAPLSGMKQSFVVERTRRQKWRRQIALMLWDMCYGFGTAEHWNDVVDELIETLRSRLAEIESAEPCTTGLAV